MDEESKKIDHLERIINNLNQYWHSIQLLLSHVSKPLLVDDRGLANVLRQITETLSGNNIPQIFQEMKYIGKRLNNIEEDIRKIKEQGLKKSVHLEFTCDGYELVKKPKYYDKEEPIEEPNKDIENLLETLDFKREQLILIHRLGLLGEKEKTYDEIGKIFKVSRERIRQLYARSLKKLRHPSRKQMMDRVKNKKLLKAVGVERKD